jgi:hypothetical protein
MNAMRAFGDLLEREGDGYLSLCGEQADLPPNGFFGGAT